jgi:hypothetical protein
MTAHAGAWAMEGNGATGAHPHAAANQEPRATPAVVAPGTALPTRFAHHCKGAHPSRTHCACGASQWTELLTGPTRKMPVARGALAPNADSYPHDSGSGSGDDGSSSGDDDTSDDGDEDDEDDDEEDAGRGDEVPPADARRPRAGVTGPRRDADDADEEEDLDIVGADDEDTAVAAAAPPAGVVKAEAVPATPAAAQAPWPHAVRIVHDGTSRHAHARPHSVTRADGSGSRLQMPPGSRCRWSPCSKRRHRPLLRRRRLPTRRWCRTPTLQLRTRATAWPRRLGPSRPQLPAPRGRPSHGCPPSASWCVRVCLCVYVRMSLRVCVYESARVCLCVRVGTRVSVCVYACVYVCMRVPVCVFS